MSNNPLIKLSKTLSRKNRFDVLKKLGIKSHRNVELSDKLDLRKERVSEAISDLVAARLVILFEREAIISEKHTMYVASPLGNEILSINDKIEIIKEKFPEKISDFGDGIAYILKYYLETDVKVTHNTVITRSGRKVNLIIKREACDNKNCEITCEPLIQNIVKRFGNIDQFERKTQEECCFNVKFWRK